MAKADVSNSWYVITGGPCSGKTALIKELEKRGYTVFHEAARSFIDAEVAKGRTKEEIRKDEVAFQKVILDLKIEAEKTLPQEAIIFFDRGIPDSDTYYQIAGIENDPYLAEAVANSTYKKAFLLEPVPYKEDYARTEDRETQLKIHELLRESYEKHGTPIVELAATTLTDRLEKVLSELGRPQ